MRYLKLYEDIDWSEEDFDEEEFEYSYYKEGDKVKLLKSSPYYHQSHGEVGVIISHKDGNNWTYVRWKNGAINGYRVDIDIVKI